MSDNDEVKKGVSSTPEEKAEIGSLRAVFDAKSAMDRLDSYAKWLFGSASVIASLGAGLSNAAFARLRGFGTWCFAIAIVAFGVSLTAASRSIAPKWEKVKLDDLESLRNAVEDQFKKRRKFLTVAAMSFAIAIVLAAFAPLLSLLGRKNPPALHFSVDEKGKLTAGLEATGLTPGTIGELRIKGATLTQGTLPSSSAAADDSGQLKLTLEIENTAHLTGRPELESCLRRPGQKACFDERRIPVPK